MAKRSPSTRQGDPPRVLLLIETSTSWGTGICEGIAQYAQEHGRWRFTIEPTGKNDLLRLPKKWKGDGVLARVNSQLLADDLVASGLPAVNVSWYHFGFPEVPRCTANEAACAELAFQHLHDHGLRHFAYVGPRNRPGYVDQMGAHFAELAAEKQYSCKTFTTRRRAATTDAWVDQSKDMTAWLKTLPKPVGLLAWGGFQARRAAEACNTMGLSIPGEVAILSSEWDELMELMSLPILSAVDQDPHRVGYESARLLDAQMRGEPKPDRPFLIPPKTVIAGPSTDLFAFPDEDLVAALRYIRRHLRDPIPIAALAEHTGISRRTLEQSFRKHLGRAPGDEIRRQRIEHAKQLFASTDWSMSQVRKECGIQCSESFSRAFRKVTGMTPKQFMAKHTA